MRIFWRESNTTFPSACAYWTDNTAGGCNRVVLQQSSCVGPVPEYSVVFTNEIAEVNIAISDCVGPKRPGKLQ